MSVQRIPVADAAAWRAASAGLPADVYHDPAYIAAAALGQRVELVVATSGGDRLAVPLVIRPVPEWLGEAACDAESPYGYAAPLVTGNGLALWPELSSALAADGIVNVFLRGHPGLDLALPEGAWRQAPHATAAIPLADGEPFAGARCANQRSQMNRGEKQGFRAEVQCPAGDLTEFRAIYDATMDRLEAGAAYRFSDAYYAALNGLGEAMALVTVRDPAGQAAAAALFFAGPVWAHYHLSGRADGAAGNVAGNLLFPAAAAWAAGKGCRFLHLGGGTTAAPDDSLLAYKKRIGRLDTAFPAGGVLCDPVRHATLVERWRHRTGKPGSWFQTYRQQ